MAQEIFKKAEEVEIAKKAYEDEKNDLAKLEKLLENAKTVQL